MSEGWGKEDDNGGFGGGFGDSGGNDGGFGDSGGFGGEDSGGYGGGDDRPRGRGRGGRGGRGGGRGRGRRDGDGDDGGFGGGGFGDDENGGDRGGRGRGGRGGGGGRGGDENGDKATFNEEAPKEFYIPPEPSVDEADIFGSGITSGINFNKYDKIPMKITGENPPPPINSFAESGLSTFLMTNIEKSGYTQPTPIQKAAIPVILAKRDLMGCSQTGSGKTAAFLIPIVHDLLSENIPLTIGKPQVLIISPTRELTIQIYNEACKFANGSYLKLCILYGGTCTRHQSTNIGKGCHILVSTPGRLLDFLDKGYFTFDEIRYVVLDEADRMLDMGFKPAIERVMGNETMVETGKRRTLLFSATFPQEIQVLAGNFLNPNYIFVSVGLVGGACSDVAQSVFLLTKFTKREKLVELLNGEDPSGTIVFVETKRQCDFLASFLSESGLPTTSIHGDRLQSQREEALRDFKNNKMKILVATSVAARGLDIKNVRHVINFDMPKDIDEYVHRIGRTGRLGNEGKASSFFVSDDDSGIVEPLKKILQEANTPIPDFLMSASGGGGGGYGGRSNNADIDCRDSGQPTAQAEEDGWD